VKANFSRADLHAAASRVCITLAHRGALYGRPTTCLTPTERADQRDNTGKSRNQAVLQTSRGAHANELTHEQPKI
jgi:hypothetical protein